MTFRERIKEIIADILTANDQYVDTLGEEANTIAYELEDLAGQADQLFLLDGSIEFVRQVNEQLAIFAATGADMSQAFPYAGNIRLFLRLANRLTEDQLDLDVPANIGDLVLRQETSLEHPYFQDRRPRRAFGYENLTVFEHTVVFLDLTSELDDNALDDSLLSQNLTAITCLLIGQTPAPLANASYSIAKDPRAERRKEYLKYQMLLDGVVLTLPAPAQTNSALAGISTTVSPGRDYIQFKEPFEILSEANSRSNILDRYLSCYHVLENYMIRQKIAEMQRRTLGAGMFGIRRLKSLSDAVAERELSLFSSLFSKCWSRSIGGLSLDAFVTQQKNIIIANPGVKPAEFNRFLEQLEVGLTYANLGTPDLKKFLPTFLYNVRCAIVHNKETEYHLSNRELRRETIKIVISDFCIPVMQRLAFGLPSVATNSPIRYSGRKISLY